VEFWQSAHGYEASETDAKFVRFESDFRFGSWTFEKGGSEYHGFEIPANNVHHSSLFEQESNPRY